MTKRYLWICEVCGDHESSPDDVRPHTWREGIVFARGDTVRGGGDTRWLNGDICQSCFFSLDTLIRDWRDKRYAEAHKPAPTATKE